MQATQRTHAVVLHYIRLLTGMAVADLIQVLPGLPKLIGTCQIGPECAMALYRPVLRNLYKLSGSDPAAEKLLQGVVSCLQRYLLCPVLALSASMHVSLSTVHAPCLLGCISYHAAPLLPFSAYHSHCPHCTTCVCVCRVWGAYSLRK